jgi:hypothetical protein
MAILFSCAPKKKKENGRLVGKAQYVLKINSKVKAIPVTGLGGL